MAQVEYQGIKVGGSKWLMILPLIGTLVGGLWGGFELYNRLLLAEGKLQKINPTAIMAEVETLRSVSEVIKEELRVDIDMVIADVERLEDGLDGVGRRDVVELCVCVCERVCMCIGMCVAE